MFRTFVVVFSLWPGLAIGAGYAETAKLATPDEQRCIENIIGGDGLAGGIATAALETEAFVKFCAGGWARVEFGDSGLAFLPIGSEAAPLARVPPAGGDGLPDGEVTLGAGRIREAWLTGPTAIYDHGILGDNIEASGLRVAMQDGTQHALSLDGGSVFEDLRVRLADLTGDGAEELLVVRSYLDRGGALAVYGVTARGLEWLGESPPIGQPYRWLNPAGVADFDGDGTLEAALVETPHIGGILRVYTLGAEGLKLEHSVPGFSNHAIGSRVLDLSAVVDWNADAIPDLALPDAARRRLMVVTLAGGRFEILANLALPAAITMPVLATDLDRDGKPELLFGLADGTLVLARP